MAETQTTKKRGLYLLLALTVILGASIYGMGLWQRQQEARLHNMKVQDLEVMAKNQPTSNSVIYALGLAYARDSQYSKAIAQFLAVLSKDPARADILNDLGVVYLLQGRYYESLVVLEGALRLKPDYPAVYANMGRLHLATKMPFTATRELEKADKLEPKNLGTLCDLGQAYQRTLNYKLALGAYQKAMDIDGAAPQALIGAGQAYYAMTQYDKAEEALKKALVITPNDSNALLALGRVQLERAVTPADLTSTQDTLEKALRADPDEAESWYMLGRLRSRQGKNTEALEMQKRALRIAPNHTGALHQLERCLRAVGRDKDADKVAKVHEERKLHDRREMLLEEQITRNTNDWDARAELVQIYLESGKRSLAVLMCDHIQKEKPDHPLLPKLLQMINVPQTSPVPSTLLKGNAP